MKSARMYKIYVNQTKVLLLPSEIVSMGNFVSDDKNLVAKYTGKTRHILNYIDMFEKSARMNSMILHSADFKQLKSDFLSLFKVVEAAGGVVLNERNEILFIHRRGFWDLPKGKIELSETRRVAASREVIEETGIDRVQLDKKLLVTHHTYKNKSGKRCIKKTHWYLMFGIHQNLTPQVEEDIEQTRWMTLDKFYGKERPVYENILDVLTLIKTRAKYGE